MDNTKSQSNFLWNRVLRYISKRERCEKEIRDYINNISVPIPTKEKIEEIITRLKSLDFLNEDRYAKAFIHDSFHLKNKGIGRIAHELKNKGINEEIIDKYLNNIDKEDIKEKAEDLARKRYVFIKNLPVLTIKRRLYGQLVRRGFSPEIAMSTIDTVLKKR